MIGSTRIVAGGVFLAVALPAIAAEELPVGQKNLCVLAGENCPERKRDILEIIEELKREIAKGSEVYTREELQRLIRKLEEYESLLDRILYHGND